LEPLRLPDGPLDAAAIRAVAALVTALLRRRQDGLEHVRRLAEDAARADREVTEARSRLQQLALERDAAAEHQREAALARERAGNELIGGWERFLSALTEVEIGEEDAVREALASWVELLEGANPAEAALAAAAARARNRLAEERAGSIAAQEVVAAAIAELQAERDRLLSGATPEPASPRWRQSETRRERPGAPLWRLVDFLPTVSEEERSGVEAALEAAGLLDAWITPEGRLLGPDLEDVAVQAGSPVHPNLTEVLRPTIDSGDPQAAAVDERTVSAILAGIGRRPAIGASWVAERGAWGLGVAVGRWRKDHAEFVGQGARDAARRRRLAEIEVELGSARRRLEEADAAVRAVEARQGRLEAEVAGAPPERELRDRHRDLLAAAAALEDRHRRSEAQAALAREAEAAALVAAEARDQSAGDLALPAGLPALRQVSDALADYRVALAALWPEVRAHAARLQALRAGEAELARAEVAGTARATEEREARNQAAGARARYEALRETIGATVEEIRRALEEVSHRLLDLEGERERLAGRRLRLREAIGQARRRVDELGERLGILLESRGVAVAAFQRFAQSGLLVLAAPDLEVLEVAQPWAPDPAVRLARRLEQLLTEVEATDEIWDRVQSEVQVRFKDLADAAGGHGAQAVAEVRDDRLLVTVVHQGRAVAPEQLVASLTEEIAHRDRLLDAKERELLEEHLVNEVASHLQELITDAEGQVLAMNQELEERPTGTGMRLRVRWEIRADGPIGLAEARARLLRQTADAWSPADRAAVSGFLQALIQAERAESDGATWLEQLTRAFDYRSWHTFKIERFQDGRWRPGAGPASSGERALTVTLPLFAAASAHYRSAHDAAPRLVLLDEAFAGVDDESRARSMGLLDAFDLDYLMTSEREWGCYPTVSGLSIHQLARREGIDAVHVTRWEWDGRQRRQIASAIPPMRPPDA
ncbi:MAG: TIGR02680 family protein, partial [Candidatus Dormibacteraceae bacterium]